MKSIWLILSLIVPNYAALYQLTDDEYDLMPPVFHIDEYKQCLRRREGRYCSGYLSYVADGDNALMDMIQKYSEHDATRYNHSRALYGICITDKRCSSFYNNATADLTYSLEACLNSSVWQKYKLKVKLDQNWHCYNGEGMDWNGKSQNFETSDLVVVAAVVMLLIANIAGSIYHVFFTENCNGYTARILLCFSIQRNMKKLSAPSDNPDPRLKCLKGMHGLRVILTVMVIIAHAALTPMIVIENPKFVEEIYENDLMHIFLNGTQCMQIFFFVSAFLLVYNLEIHFENRKVSWKLLVQGVLGRWLRLTPTYALVFGFTATWLKYLNSGAIWHQIVEVAANDCKKYWRQHLFYINNYIDGSRCTVWSWYLAADTQLYCLGLIVYVCCRTSKAKKIVISSMMLIGVAAPVLHTYFQDLDGTFIPSPSSCFTVLVDNAIFNSIVRRGHTNLFSYALGLAAGYFFYQIQKENRDWTKNKVWRLVLWCTIPLYLWILIQCKKFYMAEVRPALGYRVLASATIRPTIALLGACCVMGIVLQIESVVRGIFEWNFWRFPSKVGYAAYLVHNIFNSYFVGSVDSPMHVDYTVLLIMSIKLIVFTYTTAVLLLLMVESPVRELSKMCLKPSAKKPELSKDKHY